ncbi:carbohydrate-binding module family 48 protein [Macroventuria anomochaeta]|uniref:Carbohydrate-binding module family 48 protein n=1 Tax=Macroventuria anomochaeta TaxID=301207 RepID=A0ACB6RQ92_9PLEO|nr:carbohydrate-binding module family 48 protein [Macroventuria anomochaeta]KAF2623908.1 carbohydrate-binding module family 48 protein [Macroventuria anomochaeta]
MGKYTFTWEHDANDVYVTGTFDDWKKTVQLEEEGGVFKKTVELPKTKTQYKFVVNGNWCINESAPKEDDGHGIVNNILLPEDIVDEPAHTLSSAAPTSSTAALAGAVPKEKDLEKTKSNESIPGAFPMTPTPSTEQRQFINPIPATAGLGNPIKLAPEEHVPAPSTLTDNTVESTVNLKEVPEEDEDAKVSVAPIPATAGAGNPIHLAPGEKVPHPSTLTSNTISSTARTDEASYNKSDSQAPQLPPVDITPQSERPANGGMFGLPPQLDNLIPESSLPMGVDAKVEKDTGVHIQSAAPTSSTAALAGQVPKEPRGVPEIVTESQKEAGYAPEAAANSEAVLDKKQVEQELKETVPEKTTVENDHAPTMEADKFVDVGDSVGAVAGGVAAVATVGAGLFTGAIYATKEKAAEAAAGAAGLNGSIGTAAAGDVPVVVAESQKEAHASPEAAANAEAVHEKSQFEQELLSQVPKSQDHGESAPSVAVPAIVSDSQRAGHASPEAAANFDAVHEKQGLEDELLRSVPRTDATGESAPAIAVPAVVSESQREAHASPEAAANPLAVHDKREFESELLKSVSKTDESGEHAPVIAAASSTATSGSKTELPVRSVPDVVAESQKEAHAAPEATANAEAVAEKKELESELLSQVKKTNESGEPAPTLSAATATTAPGSSGTSTTAPKPAVSSSKTDTTSAPTTEGLNAPASSAAQTEATKAAGEPANAEKEGLFKPTTLEQGQPTVTTGTETGTTGTTSQSLTAPETPQKDRKDSDVSPKGTPGSQSLASNSATADKKNKRRSFFGKLKDKFSGKN